MDNGLGTAAHPHGSLPHCVTHLEQWLHFQPGVLSPTQGSWSSCCSSGTALEPSPTHLLCPASRALSRSKNLVFRPQGLGWATQDRRQGPQPQTPLYWHTSEGTQILGHVILSRGSGTTLRSGGRLWSSTPSESWLETTPSTQTQTHCLTETG